MRFPAQNTSSYACNADGRSDRRTVTWLQKFLGWMNYQIFSGMGLRSRASRLREAPLY